MIDHCAAYMEMQDDSECSGNVQALADFVRAVCVRGGKGHWTHGLAIERLGVTQAEIDGWCAEDAADRARDDDEAQT